MGSLIQAAQHLDSSEGAHYVYVHRGPDGKMFYVGKGVGGRAQSTERLDIWHHYVETRCAGKYDVEIVAYFDTHDEAIAYEEKLISQFGPQLVNWNNPGRQFDYGAIEKFHRLRDANRALIAETRSLEQSVPEEAIRRYRMAVSHIDGYACLVLERGLIAELTNEVRNEFIYHIDATDLSALFRLTLLLERSFRYQEIVEEIDRFFMKYPLSYISSVAQQIMNRRTRVVARLARLAKKQ